MALLTGSLGLKLEGAAWDGRHVALNDGQTVSLGPSQLTWQKRDEAPKRIGTINLPVYLNGDRSDVLFSIDLEADGLSQAVVAQRGVCLTAA